jgi:hypothetical protein
LSKASRLISHGADQYGFSPELQLVLDTSRFQALSLPDYRHHRGGNGAGNQDKIVSSISRYVGSLFGAGNKGWISAKLRLIPPDKTTLDNSTAWQLLVDQCTSDSRLIQSKSEEQVFQTLHQVFGGLKTLAGYHDPSIMVKFWPLCITIRGICLHMKTAKTTLLDSFF